MNLFSKLFGSKNKDNGVNQKVVSLISEVLENIVSISKLNLSFDIEIDETGEILVEFFGGDEKILTAKEGQLLDAFQLYVKRVIQHQLPEERVMLTIDCNDFRKEADQSLIDLAEKLKEIVVSKSKPVYFRALSPRDRKVIHQYLAEDGRVQSRSIGEGLYKKIRIYPTEDQSQETRI